MTTETIEEKYPPRIVPVKVANFTLSSSYEMPYIGYGTWQPSGKIRKILPLALEYGYTLIDTEPNYNCEESIGEVLRNWFNEGHKRDELFIVTRCIVTGLEDPDVEGTLKKSMAKLGLNYVDMYLLGRPLGVFDEEDKVDSENHPTVLTTINAHKEYLRLWKEMEKQVKEGRAKSIGLSNFSEFDIFPIVTNAEIKPSNLQIEFTIYNQQRQLLDFCKRYEIHVTAYSVLGSSSSAFHIKSDTWKSRTYPLDNPVVQGIAETRNLAVAQVLLRHALQSGVSVLTCGTTRAELKENIWTWYYELNEQDMRDLVALDLDESGRLFSVARKWTMWEPSQNYIPRRQSRVLPSIKCRVL